jgi:hypothetical protein
VLYGEDAQVELVSRPGRGTKVKLSMPLTQREAGDGLLTMLAETVRLGVATIEEQRHRFARMGPVGRRDG